jgi:kinesin family protein 1/kinesin family protein 3/17
MQGAPEGGELQGIIPRLNNALFERINMEKKASTAVQFLVTASYFEIYNEVIFDLLDATDRKKKPATAKGGLEIKEHPVLGVYVKGLQEYVVESASKLQKIIDQGMRSRTVASTQMNADSSRSHSVFVITVRQKDIIDETKNVFAKVNLVDLAGSERVRSTGASGATLKEGANINKSLSELGNVINALVAQAKGKRGVFVPYRNSKLTRVLQESLGGNSITAMLAALSPAGSYFDETLSTLKYANRAKAIKVIYD